MTAVALAVLALTTGCERSTSGSVALTTQPGPPLTTSRPTATALPTLPGLPGITLPNIPGMPGMPTTSVPVVPAPANARTMTCREFNGLDEPTRVAVVRAILANGKNGLGPDNEDVGRILAESACKFFPDVKVNEVLMGG